MKRLLSIVLLALLLAPSVQAQEPFKVYLPVILSCFNQDNNWRIIQPVGTQNRLLNPSGEIAGSFADVAGGVTTRSTSFAKYGLYSYNVITIAGGDGTEFDLLTLGNTAHYVTLRARKPYPTLQATLNTTTHTLRLVEKIDEDWDLLGVGFQAVDASGATTLDITATAAGDFYLDGLQAEPLAYWTTYCDGTQDGCGWLGTPNASASERSGASRAGGKSLDFWTEYGFQVQKVIGAGAASHKLGIDSYALLPGGALNSDKILSREFQIIGKFIAESEADLLEKKRALESAFYTNDNQLTRLRFNGGLVQKELAVRYQAGLEGDLATFYGNVEIVEDERYTEHELYTEKAAIQVVAPYPYWQEVGESAALLDTEDDFTFRFVTARLRATGQWDDLGPPNAAGTYSYISAITEDSTYIYIGGNFLNFDNIAAADYIVRYNKQTGVYSALGGGLNGQVWAIATGPDGSVYIGGAFTNAGGVAAADYLTRWDGTNFNAVGTPVSGAAAITDVKALVFSRTGNLYIGGNFANWANIAAADNIVMWNGTTYSALASGTNGEVAALLVTGNNDLIVGGLFALPFANLTRWNGSAFNAIGAGTNGEVYALTELDNNIIIGGDFTSPDDYIILWNGTSFVTMGAGLANVVRALAVAPDNTLYVAGQFHTTSDGVIFDGIIRWNGYAWAHLDQDLAANPSVFTIWLGKPDPTITQNYDIWLGTNGAGSSQFAGLITPTNGGNVAAFPRISFTRSGGTSATIATLRNESTGKELLFSYALLDGETLTIDLTPGQRSIVSSFFGPRPDAILANSDFGSWVLVPGDNDVTSFVITVGAPIVTGHMLWREGYSGY